MAVITVRQTNATAGQKKSPRNGTFAAAARLLVGDRQLAA
jgi:hypothetical protein